MLDKMIIKREEGDLEAKFCCMLSTENGEWILTTLGERDDFNNIKFDVFLVSSEISSNCYEAMPISDQVFVDVRNNILKMQETILFLIEKNAPFETLMDFIPTEVKMIFKRPTLGILSGYQLKRFLGLSERVANRIPELSEAVLKVKDQQIASNFNPEILNIDPIVANIPLNTNVAPIVEPVVGIDLVVDEVQTSPDVLNTERAEIIEPQAVVNQFVDESLAQINLDASVPKNYENSNIIPIPQSEAIVAPLVTEVAQTAVIDAIPVVEEVDILSDVVTMEVPKNQSVKVVQAHVNDAVELFVKSAETAGEVAKQQFGQLFGQLEVINEELNQTKAELKVAQEELAIGEQKIIEQKQLLDEKNRVVTAMQQQLSQTQTNQQAIQFPQAQDSFTNQGGVSSNQGMSLILENPAGAVPVDINIAA